MSARAFNVWIEVEQVELIDGIYMHYEDHSDRIEYPKAGRFDSLDDAVAFGNQISRLAAVADSAAGITSVADAALVGLDALAARIQRGDTDGLLVALFELMDNVGLELR